ncbi:hypothetical protein DK842_20640 [Chromobacterium phragmitis]|uniref:Uncharacterized protein n=1 Tax=Chromobacterium phragmitis TaxID=2202141 RepID=A0A344UDY2_9NEIS|nr:hypothetical protein [Chromobacterium phragmitis]AXE32092.1 hypothetical protein DK842_20640 [Chromobacterium phragmitis]AXE33480.1 hypothetical protein DK843_03605 [Chromobacterium phragmitis]
MIPFGRAAALAAFCCAAAQAAEPSKAQVGRWLGDVGKIELGPMHAVALKGGEKGYVIEAEFPEQGRNFMQGYVLARPARAKAIVLDGYGGQTSDVGMIARDDRKGDMLVLGSAGSGQGSYGHAQYVVVLDGWKPRVLFKAEEDSNYGDCGYDGKPCEGSQVFLNVLDGDNGKIQVAVTTVRHSGLDEKRMKSSVSAKIVTLSHPK